MASAKNFFSASQLKLIEYTIRSAEQSTSGEIRVHAENGCKTEATDRAAKVFHKLGMHKTALRNGVLLYLAIRDQKFAVIGDEGIHKYVPEGFWNTVRDQMQEHFRQQKFTEGISLAIEMTGNELKKYFPVTISDKNELSNEVTFGK